MSDAEQWMRLETNTIDIAQLEMLEQTIWNHPYVQIGNFTDNATGDIFIFRQLSDVNNNRTYRIRAANSQDEKRFEFSKFDNKSSIGDLGEKAVLGVIDGELYLNREAISNIPHDDVTKAFGLIADVRKVLNV